MIRICGLQVIVGFLVARALGDLRLLPRQAGNGESLVQVGALIARTPSARVGNGYS